MSELKKKVKVKKKKKTNSLVPVKNSEKSLVVIKKQNNSISKIYKNEVVKSIVKKISITFILTSILLYIRVNVSSWNKYILCDSFKKWTNSKRCFCKWN